ncbi:methionyl-tRNA formyltransferase [Clostridium thermosuccinogenes]|nr:methionyl-tRNA formyltransferase [Pseudoclostridium thermosuccinogenes]
MRIVFMGTPDFAVPSLKMLIDEGYEVAAVVTQPDKPKGRGKKLAAPPVKEYAVEKGIKVLQPASAKTEDFIQQLRELAPDMLITAAYGKILPKEVLDIPPLGCINVHGSLLPKYRGAAPIQWAVINGDKTTGITTMYTDIGMDTGDMLVKREIPIPEDITSGELYLQLADLGAEVLKETLLRVKNNTLERIPQKDEEATYAPMLKKEIGLIDWNKSAWEIHNLVRGTNPWPGAYTYYKGERLRIWKTERTTESAEGVLPGRLYKVSRDGVFVSTGQGVLKIKEIQFDSSRKMTVEECWHNITEGEILGQ